MIKKYLTILTISVLISSLFIPGVMAQENEKSFVKDIPQVNGDFLTDANKNNVEDLVYYFLNEEGLEIQNLDLSQLKVIESDETFEFGGMISYDVINGSIESYSADIYSLFDYANSSVQLISKSESKYYEMSASVADSGDFSIEEISVVNGLVQRNVDTISTSTPASSQMPAIELSPLKSASADWVKVDLPSIWSYNPILQKEFDDVQLSALLMATAIAALVATVFSGGLSIVISAAGILVDILWSTYSGADAANTYVDIFKIPFGTLIGFIPGLGYIANNMYMEIDYFWIYQ